MNEREIFEWLEEVEHPAHGDRNIVDLGIVDSVSSRDGKITVTLAFPKRPDPLKSYLVGAARAAVYRHAPGGTEVEIQTIVKEPATQKKTVKDLTLEGLANVRHIIGIGSNRPRPLSFSTSR